MKMLRLITLGQAGLVARKLGLPRPVGGIVVAKADEGIRAPDEATLMAAEAAASLRNWADKRDADEGIRAPDPGPLPAGLQPGYKAGFATLEERLAAPLFTREEKAQLAADFLARKGGREA